jgi:hypothetical protein
MVLRVPHPSGAGFLVDPAWAGVLPPTAAQQLDTGSANLGSVMRLSQASTVIFMQLSIEDNAGDLTVR